LYRERRDREGGVKSGEGERYDVVQETRLAGEALRALPPLDGGLKSCMQ